MPREFSEIEKIKLENAKEEGVYYTILYSILHDGNLCPYFWETPYKNTEPFYKRCIEEGKTWDQYMAPLPDDVIL